MGTHLAPGPGRPGCAARTDVVGIFPDWAAIICFVGAVLMDQNYVRADAWH